MFDTLQNIFLNFFSPTIFEPHSEHFIPDHLGLMWFTIFANGLVVISYALIPLVAVYIVRKRKDLVFNWVFLLIGLFIFLCGATHLMHMVIFWYPLYYLQSTLDIITAIASAITSVVLFFVIPQVVKLTVPQQLEEVAKKYLLEIENHKILEADLELKNMNIVKSNQEIVTKNEELYRLNSYMTGREARIKDLQRELEFLKRKYNVNDI